MRRKTLGFLVFLSEAIITQKKGVDITLKKYLRFSVEALDTANQSKVECTVLI